MPKRKGAKNLLAHPGITIPGKSRDIPSCCDIVLCDAALYPGEAVTFRSVAAS